METRLKNTKIILTLKIIVGLIVLYRLFSLDIYAVVPHDAVRYIREAVANTYISEPNQLVQIRGFKFPGDFHCISRSCIKFHHCCLLTV